MNKIIGYTIGVLAGFLCCSASAGLNIGWAEADITPPGPVSLAGSFGARVSERVCDPITTTVLVLESGGEHVVWVSCDLVAIADELGDSVRARVAALGPRGRSGALRAHARTVAGPLVSLGFLPDLFCAFRGYRIPDGESRKSFLQVGP